MAELLVSLDTGNVVYIGEDGHPWGDMELANTRWVILCQPGVSADLVSPLMQRNLVSTVIPLGELIYGLSPAVATSLAGAQKITVDAAWIEASFVSRLTATSSGQAAWAAAIQQMATLA